jgi:dihydrofolate reductase
VTATAIIRPEIVFVVAVAENGVIGSAGSIPWRQKSDMQRFKAMTMGKPVVMGRKTFMSLPRPLLGRTNIVMTRDVHFQAAGAVVVTSLDSAVSVALGDARRRLATEIAVIGGADVYAQWMAVADRLEVTEIHARPDGDTVLAPIDLQEWQQVERSRHPKADGDTADFSYVTYRRYSRNSPAI